MKDLIEHFEEESSAPKKKRRTSKKSDKVKVVEGVIVSDEFDSSSPILTPSDLLTLDSDLSKEVAAAVDESNSVVIYQKYISITSALNINAQRLLRTVIGLIEDDVLILQNYMVLTVILQNRLWLLAKSLENGL